MKSFHAFGLGAILSFVLWGLLSFMIVGEISSKACQESAEVAAVVAPVTEPFAKTCSIGAIVSVTVFDGGAAISCKCPNKS